MRIVKPVVKKWVGKPMEVVEYLFIRSALNRSALNPNKYFVLIPAVLEEAKLESPLLAL